MKPLFLAIAFTFLFSSFSNERSGPIHFPQNHDKILLIEYSNDTDYEILKDYRRIKKRHPYIHGDRFPGLSYYDSYNKILYVDGSFKVTDSSKIILLGTYEALAISLPFYDSVFTLNRFVNDSVIQLTLNNENHILSPGQVICDTIIRIEKQNMRVIKHTTTYYLKSYGLIFKNNIIDSEERLKRETEESRIRDSIDMNDLNQLDKKK